MMRDWSHCSAAVANLAILGAQGEMADAAELLNTLMEAIAATPPGHFVDDLMGWTFAESVPCRGPSCTLANAQQRTESGVRAPPVHPAVSHGH